MASWTDKVAVQTTLQLKELFGIDEFVETGTYTGVNLKFYANKFSRVKSCELNKVPLETALARTKQFTNVRIFNMTSPKFLKQYVKDSRTLGAEQPVFIYLDAHFYDPTLPKNKRFVVLDELRALKNFRNCLIAIHDFDNGKFGHITYDGQPLNLELVKDGLLKVNPNFKFYTNTECDIVEPGEIKKGKIDGLDWDEEMESTLKFVWSKPQKTYRGILYVIPIELTQEQLIKFKLEKHG